MKLSQKFLCFFIVVAIAASSYFLATFFSKKDPEAKIYEAVVASDDTATQKSLEEAKAKVSNTQYLVFEAALFNIENNTLASEALLRDAETSLNELPSRDQANFLATFQLIRACNYWQEQKKPAFETTIQSLQQLPCDPFYMAFFNGLEKMYADDFQGAIDAWNSAPRAPRKTGLVSLCFEKSFPEYARALFVADAYIHLKQYEKAREVLKKPFPEEYAEKEVTLALKSFFNEASSSQNIATLAEGADSFLQDLTSLNPSWVNFSVLEGKILYDDVSEAISDRDRPKIIFGFTLAHKLGGTYIMSLIREFEQAISNHPTFLQGGQNELLETLKAVLATDDERTAVAEFFADRSLDAIHAGNFPEACTLIAVVKSCNPTFDFAPYRQKIKSGLLAELDKGAKVGQKFDLLRHFDTPDEEKTAFRKALLDKLFSTWSDPQGREKIIIAITDFAQVSDKATLAAEMMPFLANLYANAKESDEFITIFTLEKLVGKTQFADSEQKRLGERAKQADLDFTAGNFSECLDNVNVLLYFSPENKKFLKLKALSLYQKGSFTEADAIFENMKDDPEIAAAKKLMMLERADEKERVKVLAAMIQEGKLSQEALFDMGLDEALHGHPGTAYVIFEKIQDSSIEAKAMFAATAYLEGLYEIAYTAILALPEPVQKQHSIEAITLDCLVGMKKYDEAKKLITNFTKESPILTLRLPAKMTQFFTNPLVRFNRPRALINYYINAEEDPIKALAMFSEMKTLSEQDLLIRGQIEMNLGLFDQAKKDFLSSSKESLEGKIALGVLAAASYDLPGSESIFKELLKSYPQDLKVRSGYAKFLRAASRYDEAESEYAIIENRGTLSPSDTLLKIDTLFRNRKSAKAVTCIIKLSEQNVLSYSESIKLARIASLCQYQKPLSSLWEGLPTTFSPCALLEILKTARQIGYYNEALTIIGQNEASGATAPIAVEIAKIYIALGNRTKACESAKKALEISPSYNKAQKFLDLNEENPEYLSSRARYFEEIIKKEDLKEPMPLIAATQFFLRIYDKKIPLPGKTDDDIIYIFRCCSSIFERLVGKKHCFLEAKFLYGRLCGILDQKDVAMKQMEGTLTICPSYWQASEQKGNMELQQKNYFAAKATFTEALNFAPNKAILWLGLSQASTGCNDLFSAKFSLQEAVRFEPNNPVILIETATLLFELKTPERAISYLKQGLALDPNNVDGLKLLYLCLHDPMIAYGYESPDALAHDRKITFERLHALAPDVAEKVKAQTAGLKIDFK
jgi:tetratricopeptide (TPR) repeat protein